MSDAVIKSILISPEIHQKVKLAAVLEGITLKEYTERALWQAVQDAESPTDKHNVKRGQPNA